MYQCKSTLSQIFSSLMCIKIKCFQCKIALWTLKAKFMLVSAEGIPVTSMVLCVHGGGGGDRNLSWPTDIRGNVILISTELFFTQIFFGVGYVFAYSLDVPADVAVVLLYDPGQTHSHSPQSLFPFFLFLYCTGLWKEQFFYKLWITLLMEVMQIL